MFEERNYTSTMFYKLTQYTFWRKAASHDVIKIIK